MYMVVNITIYFIPSKHHTYVQAYCTILYKINAYLCMVVSRVHNVRREDYELLVVCTSLRIYCFAYCIICVCIGGYEIYKDPVARQKRQQQIDNKLKKGAYVRMYVINVCTFTVLHVCA